MGSEVLMDLQNLDNVPDQPYTPGPVASTPDDVSGCQTDIGILALLMTRQLTSIQLGLSNEVFTAFQTEGQGLDTTDPALNGVYDSDNKLYTSLGTIPTSGLTNDLPMNETGTPISACYDTAASVDWLLYGAPNAYPSGGGYHFNGTTNELYWPNGLSVPWINSSAFSVAVQVRFAAGENGGVVFGESSFPYYHVFKVSPTAFSFAWQKPSQNTPSAGVTITGTPAIPQDDAWHTVIFTCDYSGCTASLTVDGTAITLTLPATPWGNNRNDNGVDIAYGGAPSNCYAGGMQQFRAYNRVLSSGEIAVLTTGGVQNLYLPSTETVCSTAPVEAHMILLEQDIDAITLNTDLFAECTRDNETTWVSAPLSTVVGLSSSQHVIVGTAVLTSAPSGTGLRWRVRSANGKALNLLAVSQWWK